MTADASAQPHWYPPQPEDAAGRAAAAFERIYGYVPDGVWAAPGRVNLIGEHVDYQGGLCLPFALPQRTLVAVAARGDGILRVRSAQDTEPWEGALDEVAPGSVTGWAGYVAGVPWALRALGYEVPGLDAVVEGYVPVGAGLSSSAALECAVAVALDDLAGLGLSADDRGRARLAAACVRAENEIAGAPTGGMDQAASLRSRPGHVLLLDCRDFRARPVPLDMAGAGLELLVMDTRAHHALVDGRYGSRRTECEEAARVLGVRFLADVSAYDLDAAVARLPAGELRGRVRHVVGEIDRVRRVAGLLDAGRLASGVPAAAGKVPGGVEELGGAAELGALLDASHASLRDDFEVSCAELDLACDQARTAGALGARMTGGGFGGSAIALVRTGAADAVAGSVAAAFARASMAPPAFLTAVPSGPAGRCPRRR
jgi:galactokinase